MLPNRDIKLPPYVGWAISAGQTESEFRTDGSPLDTNWSRGTRHPERLAFLQSSGLLNKHPEKMFFIGNACKFETHWHSDMEMVKAYGGNIFRFGVSWARCHLGPGKFDQEELERVARMVMYCNRLDIMPVLTLWHWWEPGWLDNLGSWENSREMLKYWCEFVTEVMKRLRGRQLIICVLNEPTVHAMFSRRWTRDGNEWLPQYEKSDEAFYDILKALAEAYVLAARIIRDADPTIPIGIAHALNWNVSDIPGLKESWDWENGDDFYELVHETGAHIDPMLPLFDYDGINNYFLRIKLRGKEERAGWDGKVAYDPDPPLSAICDVVKEKPWGMTPEGLYWLAKEAWQKHHRPVFFLEHGYPTGHEFENMQVWDTAGSLYWIDKARSEGVPVMGITFWSLLGNFEMSEGFLADFGYAYVNLETQVRSPRLAMRFIRDCAHAGRSIDASVRAKWSPIITRSFKALHYATEQ